MASTQHGSTGLSRSQDGKAVWLRRDGKGGTGGHDTLRGGAEDDTLDGQDGHDRLHGAAGDDVLRGGNGHDRLMGNAGDDELLGGPATTG
jgi:Ca2+-binding RTX toxin-like protein